MKKKFNRLDPDSSFNSSRSGSIQSRSQYPGRERRLDFSSLMIYIRRYKLTKVKMFQNRFGLDGVDEQDWEAVIERQLSRLDPKDHRLGMVQAMLSTFGEEINLTGLGLKQLECTPIYIPHNINFKDQKNIKQQIQYIAHKTGAFGDSFVEKKQDLKNKSSFQKNFFKFNQQYQNNNKPSSNFIKSELIRDILEKKEINLNNVQPSRIQQELIQELFRAGRMVFIHENGVFPSQTPVLFTPMQFQNKKRCIHLLRWNNNLILVNIQREFMDQLQETYEIGMDSQLMSQVNWRKKLIQTFGQDESQLDIKYTMEDILLDNKEPTVTFKVKKAKKEEEKQKRVAFAQDQNIEVERLPNKQQKKQQSNLVKSPLFKQNLLQQMQTTGNQKDVYRKLNFQQYQESSKEIQTLKQNISQLQKDNELKQFVNEIVDEENKEKMKQLQLQLEQKETQVLQLEEEKKQLGELIHQQLSNQDRLIIVERKYSYLREFLKSKKVEVRPCDVQFWRIKLSHSPGTVFKEQIKPFTDVQLSRFKQFIQESYQYLVNAQIDKEDICRLAVEFDQTHDQAIETQAQILQGVVIKEVPYIGVPPWWATMQDQLIKFADWQGLCSLTFFNILPCGEKLIKAFKSSLVQNLVTIFPFENGSMIVNDLYIEFTYSRGMNVIAIINNQPRFEYARYAQDGLEGYQILDKDFRTEEPQFQDYLYDGFSLSKFCKDCGYFSSEPSVNLDDDVIHYHYRHQCKTFIGLREDNQIKL